MGDLAHTFANFKILAGTEAAMNLFRDMAEGECPTPFGFCYGGTGNGKTHLLEAMTIRLNERGLFTRYHTWGEVVSNIRRYMNSRPDEPSAEVVLDRWCRTPRLVIDDLGMGTTDTEWELAKLETIVAFRYRLKLFTAIATNQDIKQLPPRVVSRLSDKELCTMVLNKAPDFRKTKKTPGNTH